MTSAAITPDRVESPPYAALHRAEHERQRANAQLVAARNRLVTLVQLRQPYDRERFEARLRGAEIHADLAATIATFDRDVAATEAAIRPLMDTIATLDAELMRLRQAANQAADEAVQQKASALYHELVPALVRLDELSRALVALHRLHPGTVRMVTDPATVAQWLTLARDQIADSTI